MLKEVFLIDMKRTGLTTWHWLATLALASLVWAAPAGAQSQTNRTPQDSDDLTRQQLAGFDQFLDNHPDLAAEIRNNPSLVNNQEFVQNHPALQQYLEQHPEVRQDLSQNPNAVMRQEQRFERHEGMDDTTRRDLAIMDSFLDTHPEIAEQLRKNPSLVDNKAFVENHPALAQFLAQHSEIRQDIEQNPNGFMSAEHRYDNFEDHRFSSIMDTFMYHHPEIAEQLEKDPSLVNNKEFVQNHPQFQQFLAEHPELRQDFKANPNAFMQEAERQARREDARSAHNGDVTRGGQASFHEFLEGHSGIFNDLAKSPSLATNQEYLENHSELKTYLNANPQVREELNENPDSFVKSAETFDADSNAMGKGTMKVPAEPKK
jgi:hypothetical protein